MRPVIASVGLAACIAASLAAFFVARPAPDHLTNSATPVVGLVSQNKASLHESAQLTIELGDAPELLASGLSGRVVEVFLHTGDTIEHGTQVAQVDGRTVIAFQSDAPFWRTLRLGDSGPDVTELQCGLQGLGYLSDEEPCDVKFSRATQTAVRDFNTDLGLGNLTTFDPSIVLWIPFETSVVGEVLVEQGEWYPNQANPVLRLTPEVISARVTPANSVRFDPGTYGTLTFTSEPTGDLTVNQDLTLDPATAARIASSIPTAPASDGTEAVAPQNVLKASGFVDGSESIERIEVPTAAIVEDASGSCVLLNTPATPTPIVVTISGSSVTGVTYVEGDLAIDAEIILNPSDLGTTSCSPLQR